MCDINIPGLPTILTGHIVPSLTIPSLIGIWPLCKARCKVIFDNKKCNVIFNGKVILTGIKDSPTDLWMLPIPHGMVGTTPGECLLPQPSPCEDCAPHHPTVTPDNHPGINLTTFMHSVQTRANAIKFAHQSLCNPKISTLLNATWKKFPQRVPQHDQETHYQVPKCKPRHSQGTHKAPTTWNKEFRLQPVPNIPTAPYQPATRIEPPVLPLFNEGLVYPGPAYGATSGPNLIGNDDDESIANIFCFGAFADKNNGIVYHDLIGLFPFMSYDGSICFFILYHYESNSILATPIAGLGNVSIFNAYKQQFELLTS